MSTPLTPLRLPEDGNLVAHSERLLAASARKASWSADDIGVDTVASFARALCAVEAVRQSAEHLELARSAEARQAAQLELQRQAFGPLQPMVDLVEEIARTDIGPLAERTEAAQQAALSLLDGWIVRAKALDAQ